MDWVYWIKLVHTLVFLFVSVCILYIVYCGVVGKMNNALWSALVLVFLVGLVYAINDFECPLATIVHKLTGKRDVADIFFPNWFANKIMPVSTGVYIVGAMLVGRQLYRKRKAKSQTPHE